MVEKEGEDDNEDQVPCAMSDLLATALENVNMFRSGAFQTYAQNQEVQRCS